VAKPAKTDNGDPEAKFMVRRQALAWAPEKPAVLEAYAGEGHMFRGVWKAAVGRHLGMDVRFRRPDGDPNGKCWRGDNFQLIKQAMAYAPWDIVDLDAYANPWPLLRQVCKMAAARPLIVTATCTLERTMQTGGSDFTCAIAGANLTYTGIMSRWYDDIIRWALAWCQGGTKVQAVECKRLHSIAASSSTMYYVIRYAPHQPAQTTAPS
jgi:hypothetical protein